MTSLEKLFETEINTKNTQISVAEAKINDLEKRITASSPEMKEISRSLRRSSLVGLKLDSKTLEGAPASLSSPNNKGTTNKANRRYRDEVTSGAVKEQESVNTVLKQSNSMILDTKLAMEPKTESFISEALRTCILGKFIMLIGILSLIIYF